MKKIALLIIIFCLSMLLSSCTHTCTCIDEIDNVHEFEIDLSEKCSDRSSPLLGECS
jgi:hypothetical protein